MMTLKNTSKLILTAAGTLTSVSTFGAEDCEKGNAISELQANLIAVTGAQASVTQDSRKSISSISQKQSLSEADQVAVEAARSTAVIRAIFKNGERINNFGVSHHGSGFVTADGCFVITVRHVPNKYEQQLRSGKAVYVPVSESPDGSSVELDIGFGPNQVPERASGEVIFSGASPDHADHDVGVIRLSKKSRANSLPVATAEDSQLVGSEMVTIGVPNALQSNGKSLEAFADTSCEGLQDNPVKKATLGGVRTSCQGSAGDSGGPVLAKVQVKGQKVWRVVGVMAQGDSVNLNDISTAAPSANDKLVRAFSMNSYKQALGTVIKESLKSSPCQ